MEQTSKVKILWGVDIQAFQKELQKNSVEIAERFDSNTIFDANFKHSETLAVYPFLTLFFVDFYGFMYCLIVIV